MFPVTDVWCAMSPGRQENPICWNLSAARSALRGLRVGFAAAHAAIQCKDIKVIVFNGLGRRWNQKRSVIICDLCGFYWFLRCLKVILEFIWRMIFCTRHCWDQRAAEVSRHQRQWCCLSLRVEQWFAQALVPAVAISPNNKQGLLVQKDMKRHLWSKDL